MRMYGWICACACGNTRVSGDVASQPALRLRDLLALLAAALGCAARPARSRCSAEQVAPGVWFVQGEAGAGLAGQPQLHLQRRLRGHARRRGRDRRAGLAGAGRGTAGRDPPHHAAAGPPRRSSPTTTPTTSTACRPSRRPGATVIAHRGGQAYLNSDTARAAPAGQPRGTGARGSTRDTRLVPADRWIDGPTPRSRSAACDFVLQPRRPGAHARGPGGVRAEQPACCSPATWSSAAASPSSARPTAGAGSRRWTA